MTEMNELEPPTRSRAIETVANRVQLSHTRTLAANDAPAEIDRLVLTRQRVTGSDGRPYDAVVATYPNGALSTMDELFILDARRKALCGETSN